MFLVPLPSQLQLCTACNYDTIAHIKYIFETTNIHTHTEIILSILVKTEKSEWLIAAICENTVTKLFHAIILSELNP